MFFAPHGATTKPIEAVSRAATAARGVLQQKNWRPGDTAGAPVSAGVPSLL
jgi:hypothetical protein